MLQPRESQSSTQPPDAGGVHLRVEPERARLDVTPGKFAVLRVRLSVEGTPRPIKGHPSVRVVDDPAFELAGVAEKRRAERTIEFEVHGRFRDTHARDIKLAYEVDGLRADQIVTFMPVQSKPPLPVAAHTPAPATSPLAPRIEAPAVPFGRPRDPLQPRQAPMTVASARRRTVAAAVDLIAAAALVAASAVAVLFVVAVIYAFPCDDPAPGSACARTESVMINAFTIWVLFVGLPLYHTVTSIVGRSLGQRLFSLRVVRLERGREPSDAQMRAPGLWRGLVRGSVAYVGVACAGVGYVWMLFNRDRRGWHDLASGTIVIRTPLKYLESSGAYPGHVSGPPDAPHINDPLPFPR